MTDSFGPWRVQPLQCLLVGKDLRGLKAFTQPHELSTDPALAIFAEMTAAALCHSTNWARLRNGILSLARSGTLASSAMGELNDAGFRTVFADSFSPSISDWDVRHAAFDQVIRLFDHNAEEVRQTFLTEGATVGGTQGAYHFLDRLPAFAMDPNRKKSRILIQQLIRTELFDPADADEVLPAIEYHILRLYLRTGRVSHAKDGIRSPSMSSRATALPSLTKLRRAVEVAMRYTADAAELPMIDLNEAEWQIARSFCVHGEPRCDGPHLPGKPIAADILRTGDGGCPARGACDVYRDPGISAVNEPRLATKHSFY